MSTTPTTPHPAVKPRHSRRPAGWASTVAVGFLVATLFALALVPFASERRTLELQQELRSIAEPGRGLVTEIHYAIALQASMLHDFVRTGDRSYVDRYRGAREREVAAYAAFTPLAVRLGPVIAERLDSLRTLEARWHAAVDAFLAAGGPGSGAADPLQDPIYDDMLLAVANLDTGMHGAAQARRERIVESERLDRAIAVALAIVGLAAAAVVAWLGRRLHAAAHDADARRAALEEVMQSKARLMRGLSHDLKNPLNAIDGYAALMADGVTGEPNEPQRQSIARIRASVRALVRLIDDLLALSGAETGELRIESRPTDPGEIVREAVDEHRAEAHVAGHSLAADLSVELPRIDTDQVRVRQVLGNLISNAIKYTPPGGEVRIAARIRRRGWSARPGPWLTIDVADTGPGIPPDKHDVVFHEFTRLDVSGKPGSGLGLAIARRIARHLGGEITLASEGRGGTCFTLWLPAAGRADERTDAPRPSVREPGTVSDRPTAPPPP